MAELHMHAMHVAEPQRPQNKSPRLWTSMHKCLAVLLAQLTQSRPPEKQGQLARQAPEFGQRRTNNRTF